MSPLALVRGLFHKPPLPVPIIEEAPERRGEERYATEGAIEVLWFPDGRVAQTVPADVEDYSQSGMGLVVGCEFPVGALVWMVKSESEALKAIVRHCTPVDEDRWRVGVRLVRQERRRTDREPVSGKGELKWLGANGVPAALPIDVVDLSESGAGLSSAIAAPVGQSVQLVGGEFDCFGVIRHCTKSPNGRYHIGLLFARPPHNRIREVVADWTD